MMDSAPAPACQLTAPLPLLSVQASPTAATPACTFTAGKGEKPKSPPEQGDAAHLQWDVVGQRKE